ncbi:GNAT family N-acetyltransferase [Sporanaerobacter acetigenes]|uniref:Acetyltransferase (GNAT) domain-containing protein n=1 Tax=Sporanaerobacter acetigenes DSM 13106 TaxID=1123281 RepID=A0A1M5YB03_9FIRM|nr:GNAT family N-acetyltransferase [Sporanaerobacter acetigenes]SHI09162.1 Acetyltransferase (GNAT) domain-containing protein [Sporanaerobacter acetigenes DSM 13106]
MAEIRPYRVGDEEQIVNLFNEVFKKDRKVNYWHWQFLESPYGQTAMALADEDGKIIGQCTLMPSKMQVGDREILGGQSIDAMVHKDFRRMGYYENLAFYSYDLGIEMGIKFRYGFPSKEALQGILEKLGGKLVCDIPLYMDVYRLDRLAAHFLKSKGLSIVLTAPIKFFIWLFKGKKVKSNEKYEFEEIKNFDHRFDELWSRVSENYGTMTTRESSFLNWRISNHPNISYKTFAATRNGELKGYIVVKDEEKLVRGKYPLKIGSIVDIIGEDEDSYIALYERAKEYFKSIKIDFVLCWILDGMYREETLKKLGFMKTKSRIPFAVKNLTDDSSIDEYIFKEENWYLMPIEADTY